MNTIIPGKKHQLNILQMVKFVTPPPAKIF